MNIEEVRDFCLTLDWAAEYYPFDNETPCFKVGKIFCFADINTPQRITLKCDPEEAVELRERYESVIPGYHTNKKHWITVYLDGSIPKREILSWVKNAYLLVLSSLTKKQRADLKIPDDFNPAQ